MSTPAYIRRLNSEKRNLAKQGLEKIIEVQIKPENDGFVIFMGKIEMDFSEKYPFSGPSLLTINGEYLKKIVLETTNVLSDQERCEYFMNLLDPGGLKNWSPGKKLEHIYQDLKIVQDHFNLEWGL